MTNTKEYMDKIVERKVDEKIVMIESKLRNSFKAIKEDNDQIKKSISQLVELANNKDSENNLKEEIKQLGVRIDKRQAENEKVNEEIAKLKKEVSKKDIKDSIKKELNNTLHASFEKKIKANFEKEDKRIKELKEENSQYKVSLNTLFENNSKIVEQEYANKSKEFDAKVEKQGKYIDNYKKDIFFELGLVKKSVNGQIDKHKELVDGYSAKLENYSAELEANYEKSKKEIRTSVERKVNDVKREKDEEVKKLQGQISYLKGRVNSAVGKEEGKPIIQKKLEDKSSEKDKKNKTIFSNLISLLSDEEGNEVKVSVKVPAKAKEKKVEPKKIEVKKFDKQNDQGFFNSIIKSLSD